MAENAQYKCLLNVLLPFACFTDQELCDLLHLMTEVHYKMGARIVVEGESVDSIFIIIDGSAAVYHGVTELPNADLSPIAILVVGEAIGLNDLGFYSQTGFRTATVIADSDVILLRLSLESLNEFFLLYPNLNKKMAKTSELMLRSLLIKQATPFTKLSTDHVHWLMKHIEERNVAKNEIIYNQGDTDNCCYLIYKGAVEIFFKDEEGRDNILTKCGKAALFGEMALITSTPRNTSARASEPTTLLVLHKQDYLELKEKELLTIDPISSIILERVKLYANEQVDSHKRLNNDGEIIYTLHNSEQHTYYQLSKEGWFIYLLLNGNHTLTDIVKIFHEYFRVSVPNFVSELIIDLIKGDFVTYTHVKCNDAARISIISYDKSGCFEELTGTHLDVSTLVNIKEGVSWINIEGLYNLDLLHRLAERYQLHPLTLEDILSNKQRTKIEIFEEYIYISLESFSWNEIHKNLCREQINLIFGKNFVLSFQPEGSNIFIMLKKYIDTNLGKIIRIKGADYLIYRLLDTIIDHYFVILENIGEHIQKVDEEIVDLEKSFKKDSSPDLYKDKSQLL